MRAFSRCRRLSLTGAALKGCATVSVVRLVAQAFRAVPAASRPEGLRYLCACFALCAASLGAAPATDLRLIQAVKNRDAGSVRALLKQGAPAVDVNATQGDGATALHWAAHRDDLAIADLLLRAGARANAANDLGATPLHLACTNRSAKMVERLLAAGARAGAALLNGETVLMTCARAGDAAAVKTLLAHGADVNASEHDHKQTALMWATAQRHPEVVRLLVDARADVRARSLTYPQTVVGEQTQRAGREELNYTVLRGGATPLLFAARVGDVESAALLLKAGADANDAQPDGVSALVLAAHSGNGTVASLLLEHGADPNGFVSGYSALHAAILRSDLNLVKALLARGADPNRRIARGTPMRRDTTDWNLPATLIGTPPYLLAARFLEAEIMPVLAAGGADPRAKMPDGADAVMLASGMGSSRTASRRGIETIDFGKVEPESRVREAVATAVRLGGDLSAANQAGDTALLVAAALGYDTVVQLLAEHGANVNATNRRGVTPLLAATYGSTTGRGRVTAPAGADSLGFERPVELAHPKTVALLKTLGATE
jgi:ankyrin repeat protein